MFLPAKLFTSKSELLKILSLCGTCYIIHGNCNVKHCLYVELVILYIAIQWQDIVSVGLCNISQHIIYMAIQETMNSYFICGNTINFDENLPCTARAFM